MRFLSCGSRAVLAELDDLPQVLSLYGSLRTDPAAGVTRLVPGARTLLVGFDPVRATASQVRDALAQRPLHHVVSPSTEAALVEIPVRYDGPDLADVATLTSLTEAEVVARHSAGSYTATFAGYVPGWSYLVGLEPALHVPRRSSPRTKVPAGSVAVAGEFTGVYPGDAPGGWHLIGRTDLAMWDIDRDPPAVLEFGTPVRFVEVGP